MPFFPLRPGRAVSDPLGEALTAFAADDAEALPLFRRLVAALRPRHRGDEGAHERLLRLIERLEHDPGLGACLRRHLQAFLVPRQRVTFFTDSGILPGTGFFSEWWRILGSRLLPEVPDERRLKDCLHVIFDAPGDGQWLSGIPPEIVERLGSLLMPPPEATDELATRLLVQQGTDAVQLLAHRIGGLGVDEELMRAVPDLDQHAPRFLALSAEAHAFADSRRAALDDATQRPDDGGQLLVIADQCRDTLQRVRKRALAAGTSLRLSFLLARGEQNLARLHALVGLLATPPGTTAAAAWAHFSHAAIVAEMQRQHLGPYLAQLSHLLAVRVTENAARSGEHYICEDRQEYRQMWLSAAGAGVLIGFMALLKILAAGLHAPLAIEALLFSLIYGLGFVAIYLLGMTVATKQPAMTAQTLAGLLGDLRPTRQAHVERLVDVLAAVTRSQLAAIAGNVLLAFPVALLLAVAAPLLLGGPVISTDKAGHLLADLDLLGWALPHAAIAGFYLYLSGLLTGYFDNHATYAAMGARIARLRWLQRLTGRARAQRIGQYVEARLGGIMGNFLFGCMLGSTGVIGTLLGLPLDIRHIAFASANLGYALSGSDFALPATTLLWAAAGVALIGLTNLLVSFWLALRTALRARDVRIGEWGPLLGALARRLRSAPRSFFLPPAEVRLPPETR